jgi:hypothetical protein
MKTVVLIDMLSGGHRDAFMRFFARTCLQLDCRVLCIFPDTKLIRPWIDAHCPEHSQHISYTDFFTPARNYAAFGKLNDAMKALHYWRKITAVMKASLEQYHLKPDFVFFNCIDYFLGNYLPGMLIDRIFPYKWAGLYFHPAAFRIHPEYLGKRATFRDVDSIFLSRHCVAIALHDEGIISKYEKRTGKRVLLFPEMADTTPPEPHNKMAAEIQQRANGRIVIGSIGLEPHKGSYEFMRLAKMADPAKYFFAFTGMWARDDWKPFFGNAEQAEEFFAFERSVPENVYWQTGPLREGAEYNAVFCAFDIIWLIYKRFYSSSNRLTKAANFERLVLGSDKGCVGEDIPAYSLGETAEEGNVMQQLQQLEKLRDKVLRKDFPFQQWRAYAAKHSVEALKEKFVELLNLV